jgi:ubiquinone/menaquinone biosynthesis C-methylase UbiE
LLELVRANLKIEIIYLDSSRRMLEIARAHVRRAGLPLERIRFVCADVFECPVPLGGVELVVTHFFLDCFRPPELSQVISRVANAISPGAAWVVSDFQVPPFGWQGVRARLILHLAYRFFRWTTRLPASFLTSPAPELERNGFRLAKRRLFNHGLLYADWWTRTGLPGASMELNGT